MSIAADRIGATSGGARGPSPLRNVTESLILLAVAVVLFRGFGLEGYLISTGSMAPTLLGFHHRVTCPNCRELIVTSATVSPSTADHRLAGDVVDLGSLAPSGMECPYCGEPCGSPEQLPRTEGDQLLVHKHAFEFRDPRRWEVIVFRNPEDPSQAYVKRVVGLPRESLEIRDGEVWTDGQLRRKPLKSQYGMRIPVHRYESHLGTSTSAPAPPERWQPINEDSNWWLGSNTLTFEADDVDALSGPRTDWVEYAHRVAQGGRHRSSVALAEPAPDSLPVRDGIPGEPFVEEDRLVCVGVLNEDVLSRWEKMGASNQFLASLAELAKESQLASIDDVYDYNTGLPLESRPVDDLMLSLTLHDLHGEGRFEMQLTDGDVIARLVVDCLHRRLSLLLDSDPVPVREMTLSEEQLSEPLQLDLSLFDDQVLVGVNGREAFAAVKHETRPGTNPLRRPARIGAAGVSCEVSDLTLFRDVYYTPREEHENPTNIGSEAFFVLGDNSPVSIDSRVWEAPQVPRAFLIGKPLVVHLPSTTKRVRWGGQERSIRMPEFSRARVIR